ncbi:MAG: hypothetical protein RL136_640 [Planctomycetota bacterium]
MPATPASRRAARPRARYACGVQSRRHTTSSRSSLRRGGRALALAILLGTPVPCTALAQQTVIPAISDSPTAQTLIGDLRAQAAANPAESARIARKLLDEYGARVVRIGAEKDELFRSVADETERFLLSEPEVLARFRDLEGRTADRMLVEEGPDAVASRRRLTPAGLRASLMLAERALRSDRAAEAADELRRVTDHPDLDGAPALVHAALEAMCMRRLGRIDLADAALARIDAMRGVDDLERRSARDAAQRTGRSDRARSGRSPLASSPTGGDPDETWREIWSLDLDESLFRRFAVMARSAREIEQYKTNATLMCSVPSVLEGRIFISEGGRVRAVDADSRDELWTRAIGSTGGNAAAGPAIDLNAIAVAPRSVVTFEGHGAGGGRTGAPRVWCLDPATGARRWDVLTDGIDGREDLAGLYPIGTPVIASDVVVVAARKPTQRLEQVDWLLGLDEDTGALRWALSVAGAPSPRSQLARKAPGVATDGRIVVHTTPLGVITAVRARDGAVEWLRRFPVPLREPRFFAEPWEVSSPAIVGGLVVAITPDEQEVVSLDASTGRLIESRPVGPGTEWGAPTYLVSSQRSDGTPIVLSVGTDVRAFDARDLSTARWSYADSVESIAPPIASAGNRNGIRGRVSIAGDYVVIPTTQEIFLLDLGTGAVTARVPTGVPGNPLLLDDRIVVAGDESLRVLMPSEQAEAVLRARLASTPEDPSAAIALVELAQATGRPQVALDAGRTAERALSATDGNSPLRIELIEKLSTLAAAAPEFGDAAYELAFRVAVIPQLRVRVLLSHGDYLRNHGRALEAIDSWRQLASDPVLSAQLVADGSVQRQVRLEALQRLGQLASRDRDVAGTLESSARDAFAALGDRPQPGPLAVQVRAHPRSRACIDALTAATHLDEEARHAMVVAALRDNLLPPARTDLIDALRPLLGVRDGSERLQSRASSADQRIDALLHASGITRSPSELRSESAPLLGPRATAGFDLPARLVKESYTARESRDRDLILGTLDGSLVRLAGPALDPQWRLRLDDRDPLLLWSRDRIVLWQTLPKGEYSALVVDPANGSVLYASPIGSELWPREGAGAADGAGGVLEPGGFQIQQDRAGGFPGPARFRGLPSQVSPVCDDRSLILVSRTGDLARIAYQDERPSAQLDRGVLDQILAESLDHGQLALGGRRATAGGIETTVKLLDATTLSTRASITPASQSDVSWVFTTELGEVLIGTRTAVERWTQEADGQYMPSMVSFALETIETELPSLVGSGLLVRDRSTRPIYIPLLAGAPRALEYPDGATARQYFGNTRIGDSLLLVTEDRLFLLGPAGEFTGADGTAWESGFQLALEARASDGSSQILQVNLQQPEAETGKIRYQFRCVVERLDPAGGLRNLGGSFEFTVPNSRISTASAFNGWLLVSNAQGTIAVALPADPSQ